MTAYEIESKIELDQDDFNLLLKHATICKSTKQLNVYYDSHGELSCSAATFRVRFILEDNPVITLKLPISYEGGTRKSLEIEHQISLNVSKKIKQEINVKEDLPEEFSLQLERLGIDQLKRIGWMRNNRWVVKLTENLTIELDEVHLPNGNIFFEAGSCLKSGY
ncbi:CYTH domain-containing protein [Spirosoma utsteinense]|uniref:CYTH domain-containing protein n=1 Tax=Spirosoma utsteinense TaxID=2585773 RepID=UPI0016478B90|nr:CYTH domain-containing protein [Spirosoma utsteinense]MBC3789456.1 putative protein YjbK [Spirosoma utsteinense]